jgi:hypothetical protein
VGILLVPNIVEPVSFDTYTIGTYGPRATLHKQYWIVSLGRKKLIAPGERTKNEEDSFVCFSREENNVPSIQAYSLRPLKKESMGIVLVKLSQL